MKNILVIKLSAFGDVMIAFGLFEAIRRQHKDAHITLMTTKPFKSLAERSGLFDAVFCDHRPRKTDVKGWYRLRQEIRSRKFDRIYDLQNNDRTALYYKAIWDIPFLLKGSAPEWVGTVKGCSYYTPDMRKVNIHAFDRGRMVIESAGIEGAKPSDLMWMKADISDLNLPENMVLIVPGASPTRPEKKWPLDSYIALVKDLNQKGFTPTVIGSHAEVPMVERMKLECPFLKDLTCQTNFYELVEVGRKAQFAIGNDTGPMHLLALTGLPMVVLFSKWSNPSQSVPLGDQVDYIRKDRMSDILVEDVLEKISHYEQVPET